MNMSFKELQTKGLHCYIPGLGTHRTVRNGYDYEMKKDGTCKKISEKWMGADITKY